jgi:uncharacterized membrane protein
MNDLIVVSFDHLDDAREAMRHIRTVERDGQIELEDTAVIEVTPDGKAHVKNELSGATETGAAVGAVVGALTSFFLPVIGIVIGAAVGGAVGSLFDTGVDPKFVDDVKRQLKPGTSAIFLVVRRAHTDPVIAALRPFKGEVIQTTLPSDAEDELRRVLAD